MKVMFCCAVDSRYSQHRMFGYLNEKEGLKKVFYRLETFLFMVFRGLGH